MADMTPEQRADGVAREWIEDGTSLRKLIATTIRDAEERGRLAERESLAGTFERLDALLHTPASKVSAADKALYSAMADHFEPIGRSILPNWKAMAAAIRAAGERESGHG